LSASIIDGNSISKQIRAELSDEVKKLQSERNITPGLAVVLVGENPASQVYVRMKEKACEEVGLYSRKITLPEDTSEKELLDILDELNGDNKIHGILVQLPLPKHIDENKVLRKIDPEKDVDGFHPVNVGKLVIGEPSFVPCTPQGVIELLKRSGTEISGADAVIVGRSNIVGKPVAMLLMHENATVTVCHSKTKNLAEKTQRADILVAAIGRPKFITADMVKEGATVIDVGVNRLEDKLVGDVDFEPVKEKAGAITPVPGGVGPMTIAMLLTNTVKSASKK
jgi:methylenetetrahydrofolate dehydrogenase (NADP+)/methenyltetrahydrofolate cyclohydrolase